MYKSIYLQKKIKAMGNLQEKIKMDHSYINEIKNKVNKLGIQIMSNYNRTSLIIEKIKSNEK